MGLDYESYEKYYAIGIKPIVDDLLNQYNNVVFKDNAKEVIWEEYKLLNNRCKYGMKNPINLLDRHKVVACYMYAIEKANVLLLVDSFKKGDNTNLLLNERLAVTFGLSMLRSLVLDLAERIIDEKVRAKIQEAFENDIALPKCTHGEHNENLLWQLYYTRQDNSYNVLALSETLYLIEAYNLIKCGVDEDYLKLENIKH